MLIAIFKEISGWTIPLMLVAIPVYGYLKGINVYNTFIKGAREGVMTGVRIIPYLVAIFVAIAIFRTSGVLEWATNAIAPFTRLLHVPAEVMPLVLIRPLSGNGAMGVMIELLKVHGPDSLIGRMASVLQGSTETTFYVLTVYFGAIGVKNTRHTLAVGLLADLAAFLGAAWATYRLFG
ncbi:MAG: spore maturation protein [Firmicutes bacterium]|nr:spore maturation protein [Bacillota bacterium]